MSIKRRRIRKTVPKLYKMNITREKELKVFTRLLYGIFKIFFFPNLLVLIGKSTHLRVYILKPITFLIMSSFIFLLDFMIKIFIYF